MHFKCKKCGVEGQGGREIIVAVCDDCMAKPPASPSPVLSDLLSCPCGQFPKELHISGEGSKWAFVSGDCCDEWFVEFRTQYHKHDSPECMKLAIIEWNRAQRWAAR